jgi:hypothetical protein
VLDSGNFLTSILRGLNNFELFKPLIAYLYRDMHSHTRAVAGAGDACVSSGHVSLSSSTPAADGAEERALQERAPLDSGVSMRERLTAAPLTAAATTIRWNRKNDVPVRSRGIIQLLFIFIGKIYVRRGTVPHTVPPYFPCS